MNLTQEDGRKPHSFQVDLSLSMRRLRGLGAHVQVLWVEKNMHFTSIVPKHSPVPPGLHLKIRLDFELLCNLTKLGKSSTFNKHHLVKLNMDFPFPW